MNAMFPGLAASKADEQEFFNAALEIRESKRLGREERTGAFSNPKDRAAYRRGLDAELLQGKPNDPVAFERINLTNGECYYVGKQAFSDELNDHLVLSWQARLITELRKATPSDPGQVSSFRRFATEAEPFNMIKDIEDQILADLLVKVEALSDPDTHFIEHDSILQSALNQGRDEQMRDIVQTIMASQSALISMPAQSLLLIQGGPGTGKTSVALHRVSWLLHNYSGRYEKTNNYILEPQDVAIVGPNPTFTRYISRVLPELGDEGVLQFHFLEFISDVSPTGTDSVEGAKLKSEVRMEAVLSRALRQRVRPPKEDSQLHVSASLGSIDLRHRDIENIANGCLKLAYNIGRESFRKGLEHYISEQIKRRAAERRKSLRGDVRSMIDKTELDNLINRIWPALNAREFLREFYGSLQRIIDAAQNDLNVVEVGLLQRNRAERITLEPWTPADIALLDYVNSMMGIKPKTFRHIVIDEAQDLSPMLLRAVSRRSENGHMTLVGDLAQSTSHSPVVKWEEFSSNIDHNADVIFETLKHGYRVPKSVMEVAASLLPLIAPDLESPIVVRERALKPTFVSVDERDDFAEEIIKIQRKYSADGKFLGIISSERKRVLIEEELKKRDTQFTNADKGHLSGNINLVSPINSKGLEFDAIIVADPLGIADEGEHGLRALYIALTRTTGELEIVFDEGALHPGLVEIAGKFGYLGAEFEKLAESEAESLDSDYEAVIEATARQARQRTVTASVSSATEAEGIVSDPAQVKPSVAGFRGKPNAGDTPANEVEKMDDMLDDLKPAHAALIHTLVEDVERLLNEEVLPIQKELARKYLIARLQESSES